MNIILSTYSYYPYNWGGTEVYVHGLAKYLLQKGHYVLVLAGMPGSAYDDHSIFYEDSRLKSVKYQYESVDVIGIVLKDETTTEIYRKYRESWTRSWQDLLQSTGIVQWDILHIHAFTSVSGMALMQAVKSLSLNAAIIASYHLPISCVKGTLMYGREISACKIVPNKKDCTACMITEKTGLPLFATGLLTNLAPQLSAKKLPTILRLKYLVRLFLDSFKLTDNLVSKWMVFSEEIYEVLQKAGVSSNKIILSRHGIDPLFLTPVPEKVFRSNDKVRFLYASRFEKVKGFHTLLKAWCGLPEVEGRILLLAGSKQSAEESDDPYIPEAALRKDITWLGTQTREELASHMKQAHCVLIPSECVEIGPLVFHEAIASGGNVIASDMGGCAELARIYSEAATPFQAGSDTALAAAIKNFKYRAVNYKVQLQQDNYDTVLLQYQQLLKTDGPVI